MSRIVFLLEERSMKVLLDGMLPRLFPGMRFLCVPHEGKNDLERSIPRKLRAWREPGVRFVVVRDNDGGNCNALKHKLLKLCAEGRREDSVVRIPCQELEAWYFGDPDALARAFGNENLGAIGQKAAYRDPDVIPKPSSSLRELIPEFQKLSGARRMAEMLSVEGNRSHSFHVFIESVKRLYESLSKESLQEG